MPSGPTSCRAPRSCSTPRTASPPGRIGPTTTSPTPKGFPAHRARPAFDARLQDSRTPTAAVTCAHPHHVTATATSRATLERRCGEVRSRDRATAESFADERGTQPSPSSLTGQLNDPSAPARDVARRIPPRARKPRIVTTARAAPRRSHQRPNNIWLPRASQRLFPQTTPIVDCTSSADGQKSKRLSAPRGRPSSQLPRRRRMPPSSRESTPCSTRNRSRRPIRKRAFGAPTVRPRRFTSACRHRRGSRHRRRGNPSGRRRHRDYPHRPRHLRAAWRH
jgi:hypothetical protein